MSIFSSISDALSSPNPKQTAQSPSNSLITGSDDLGTKTYEVNPANWFSSKPYGFRVYKRNGKKFTMFLPINPSNINIVTNFATNVIPTLYGTVEEHSDIRYYDITIEGTTGMAPKFVSPINSDDADVAYQALKQPGRAQYPIRANIAGGFFSNTIGQVTNILNQAQKAIGGVSQLFGGTGPKPLETALYTDQTGYMAFHNLYRFLKQYKRDAAGLQLNSNQPNNTPFTHHPLTFFNYKDQNEYDVAIRSFTLRKSAENPMLYYYSITMRGYNLRTSGSLTASEDLQARMADLGLDGVKSSSLLSSIKSVSSSAKAVVGSVLNGSSLLGR
jgi:hypothetical protein